MEREIRERVLREEFTNERRAQIEARVRANVQREIEQQLGEILNLNLTLKINFIILRPSEQFLI